MLWTTLHNITQPYIASHYMTLNYGTLHYISVYIYNSHTNKHTHTKHIHTSSAPYLSPNKVFVKFGNGTRPPAFVEALLLFWSTPQPFGKKKGHTLRCKQIKQIKQILFHILAMFSRVCSLDGLFNISVMSSLCLRSAARTSSTADRSVALASCSTRITSQLTGTGLRVVNGSQGPLGNSRNMERLWNKKTNIPTTGFDKNKGHSTNKIFTVSKEQRWDL